MNNGSFAVGIVEDRDDPLKMGRYRVRIFGVHSENLDDVPTNTLPWAIPLTMSSGVSGIGSTPTYTEGSTVFVFFQDGESKQQPIIMGAVNGFPVSTSPFAELEPLVDDKLEFVVKQDDGAVLVEPVVDNTVTDETTTKPDDIPPDPMIPQVAVFETAATEEPKVLAKPPKNPIAGLPDDFYKNIKISMGRRESSNNYRAVNKDSGFIGKYQFGAAAMTDLGYIIRGTSQSHFKKMIETAKELEEALTPEMLQMSSIDEIINAIDTASKTVATSTTPRLMSLIGTSATISETKLPDAIRTAMFSEPRYLLKNRIDKKVIRTTQYGGELGEDGLLHGSGGQATNLFYFRYEVYKPDEYSAETYGFIYDQYQKWAIGGFSRRALSTVGGDWYWVNTDPNAVFSGNEDDFSFGYQNGFEFTRRSLGILTNEGLITYIMPAVTVSHDPDVMTERGFGWQLPISAIEAMLAFRLNLISRSEVKKYSVILDRILYDPADSLRAAGTPSKDTPVTPVTLSSTNCAEEGLRLAKDALRGLVYKETYKTNDYSNGLLGEEVVSTPYALWGADYSSNFDLPDDTILTPVDVKITSGTYWVTAANGNVTFYNNKDASNFTDEEVLLAANVNNDGSTTYRIEHEKVFGWMMPLRDPTKTLAGAVDENGQPLPVGPQRHISFIENSWWPLRIAPYTPSPFGPVAGNIINNTVVAALTQGQNLQFALQKLWPEHFTPVKTGYVIGTMDDFFIKSMRIAVAENTIFTKRDADVLWAITYGFILRSHVKSLSPTVDKLLFNYKYPNRDYFTPTTPIEGPCPLQIDSTSVGGGGSTGGATGGDGSGEMYEFINRATDDVQTTVTTMGMARSAISVDKATRIKAVLEFNRKCWTGKDKILTIVHFFKNHPLQETCMDRYMHINEGYLKNGAGRILTSDTTAQERAGLICACHLVGHGGCTAFKGGAVRKDQSGTSAAEYYAIGVETAKGNLYGGSKQWPDTQTEGDDSTGSPEKFKSNSDIDAKNATKNNPYREPSTVPDVGVTSTEQGTKLPVWGYADPKANYPTYTKEQDYNRLGRNSNIADSIVTTKDQTLKSSVRMANAGSTWIDGKKVENGDGHWSQPPSPYNAIYPYNHVIETESGHVIELDDTPESERLHIYHRTGTFIEVDANGTKVTRVVGDNYEILDRNGFISIAGACNVNVEGTCNLSVGSTLNLEVSGDLLANVTGNIDFNTPGTFNVSADSGINLVTLSDFTNTVYGNISYTVKGKYNSRVDGTFTSVVFDKVNITSLSNFNSFVSGTSKAVVNGATTIKSGGKLNIEGGGASIIESTGDMILRSGGSIATSGAVTNFVAAGGNVKISGGTNVNVSYAVEAAPATPGPIVRWANKIFGTVAKENIFSPLATTPRNFEVMSEFDDGDVLTPEQGIERDKIMADAGVLPPAPPDAKVAEDKDAVTPEIAPSSTPVESSCDMFNSGINLNDFVSKNFKLSKLTLGRNIVAQQGLEAKELACNLKKLAENVLEKILAEYPDMIISSGLRPMGSNSKSQHPLGQAADLQFTNHKSSDYIDIAKWISKNVDTDQLILEYRTNSAQSKAGKLTTWIHVSYKGSGHRHHVFTMNNDVTVPPFGQLKLITI